MSKVNSFAVGDINCAVLLEGEAATTIDGLAGRYPDVPQAQIEAAVGAEMPVGSMNVLYFTSGGAHVLADVGFGQSGRPKMGQVEAGLNELGLSASDIDIIFLTHFHGDHIAGLYDDSGKLSFPNARYRTAQAEWDEWQARWSASDDLAHKDNLEKMISLQDKIELVQDGDALAPGVSVVGMPGHTLGHSGLLLESGDDQLLHVVDILHQPFQFAHTEWQFVFDSDGDMATETRRRILQRCADENLLTLFYHLKFPGLGHVRKDGDMFSWHAID